MSKVNILKFLIAMALVMFSATGCGSLKVRHKDSVAVAKIKKVAIVGMSVDQPASAELGLNLGSGRVEGTRGGSMIAKNSKHVVDMYDSMRRELRKNLKWRIYSRRKLLRQSAYVAAYKDTMEGWQNKMPAPKGKQRFKLKKMLDFQAGRILDVEGRDKLIRQLGVDAIVFVKVDVLLNGTSIMGIGSRYPQSRIHFQVYDKGAKSPIWFDGGVEGEEAKESIGATAFIDEDLLNKLALKSAKTAFSQIGKRKL